MATQLRIIGDVHCKNEQYLRLLNGIPYTFQVGDMSIYGFDFLVNEGIEEDRHRFIGGNHDNYNKIGDSPHCLGDYGVWSVPEFGDVFYIRGAWSIDDKSRRIGLDWWPEEELTNEECEKALELYKEVCPKLVVSHECPLDIVQFVTSPMMAHSWGFTNSIIQTNTNRILQRMREYHAPKLHVFGHYHQKLDIMANDVRYVCLPELGVLDLPKNYVDGL